MRQVTEGRDRAQKEVERHVLRRVETDPEFRERLRAALGVTP